MNLLKRTLFKYLLLFIFTTGLLTYCHTPKQTVERNGSYIKIIDGVGFEKIIINKSTTEDVIILYGDKHVLVNHNDYSYEIIYKEKGLSFYYKFNDTTKTIFSLTTFPPMNCITKKGIILGKHTMEDVIDKYGEPTWRTTDKSETWWSEYPGIEFHVERDTLLPQYPLDKEVHKKKKIIRIDIENE